MFLLHSSDKGVNYGYLLGDNFHDEGNFETTNTAPLGGFFCPLETALSLKV